MKSVIAAALVLASSALAAPAMAQPPLFGDSDYAREHDDWRGGDWGGGYGLNLSGQWVDNAKRQLANAGYRAARSIRYNGTQYDLWTNDRSRNGCIGFTSYNGRVTDVRNFRNSECGGYGGGHGGGWGNGHGNDWGLDARDLEGLSVDQAKRALANEGFRGARSIRLGGQQWDLWYENHGRRDRCVGFTSYYGRVTDAREFSERDCY